MHEHTLDYLHEAKRVRLENKISARVPPTTDPFMRGLVLDGQLDYNRSGVPVQEEPSYWDSDEEKVCIAL